MFYKSLRPIHDFDRYSDDLQRILKAELWEKIYAPLIALLTPDTRRNAKPSVLVQSFLDRKIYYDAGFVYGRFSAVIGKALRDLGATFNHTKRAYKLDLSQLPADVRSAISRGSAAEQDAIDAALRKAQELSEGKLVIPSQRIGRGTLEDLHRQFMKVTPADLEIPVEMNDYSEQKMLDKYTTKVYDGMYDLSGEMVYRLKQRVEDAVGQGMRADQLKDILQAEYGISANRAKYVARNETSNFVAMYRQTRYEDAGINYYMWSSSNDDRVRPRHRELNGRIFRFDDPPIVDTVTGERGNPGQPPNCRCVALAVILEKGKPSRPLEKFEVAGINLLETSEHLALH